MADLKNCQVILGVEWLTQIGEFTCNYQEQTMQFDWKGKVISLPASKHKAEEGSCDQLSVVIPTWMEQIGVSYEGDDTIQQLITEAAIIKGGPQEYYIT